MIKNLLPLPLFLLSLLSFSQTIEVSGPVSGIWNSDTVSVTGDISLENGQTLTIEPGTIVLFRGNYLFDVKGTIVAIGTPHDSVVFRSDEIGVKWQGIRYEHVFSGNDTSRYICCVFRDAAANGADTMDQYGGAFRIFNFGKIRFDSCTFIGNSAVRWGGAAYLKNSDVIFNGCSFYQNSCGPDTIPYGYGGGICSVSSSPVIQHCYFEGNISTGVGGAASFEFSDPLLTHNIFRGNQSGLGGALAFLRSDPGNVVSNNLVTENYAVFFGGGICVIRNHTVFANNTITENTSIYGGGLYCNDSAVPVLYNSIIYGNEAGGPGEEIYIWDVKSAPAFHYCNIRYGRDSIAGSGGMQGYHGVWENNSDVLPGFIETGPFPYSIPELSPMTDAGTPDTTGLQVPSQDLQGKSRFYNGRIDIGAYEYSPAAGLFSLNNEDINIYPNPARDEVNILFDHPQYEETYISIIDLSGKIIIRKEFKMNGGKIISLKLMQKAATGAYLLKIQNNKESFLKKLTIL